MALRKFRFLVGACGPTFLYTDIYRAEDERAAAIIRLSAMGKECTEENIAKQLDTIREIIPKETPDRLLDCLGRELSLGDEVMFIKNKAQGGPKLLSGKIEKISGKSVLIKEETGESTRIILSGDEEECISKVLVMKTRPERKESGAEDASGYPIMEGDTVAYMRAIAYNSCTGFEVGSVKKITAKNVEIEDTRRTLNRVVVLNLI